MNADLCQPKLVAVLLALAGMAGTVAGTFLGRVIERRQRARAERALKDEPETTTDVTTP